MTTIDELPDECLMEIFDLYRGVAISIVIVKSAWGWTALAHVCRRWRAIILTSPQRLHLQVTCGPRTPVRTSLDTWSPFPIVISSSPPHTVKEKGKENILAALEHRDRISDLHLFDAAGTSLKRWVVAMQEPLIALTHLRLGTFHDGSPVVLPEAFLGGHAPRLRRFILQRVAFPAFPKFVLHATHIFFLRLYKIPSSWYTSISLEAMATCLTALPDLETLSQTERPRESSRRRDEVKPERRTRNRERAGGELGAVYASCYPRCRVRAFVDGVEGVAGWSGFVVRAREGEGPQLPGTHKRREGKKRATVAWRSPGLSLDIYIESEVRGDSIRYAGKERVGEKGKKD